MQVQKKTRFGRWSVVRGPGFGPPNVRSKEASAFTAPLPVDVDVNGDNVQAKAFASKYHEVPDTEATGSRVANLSAEAHKEARGAALLLGKVLTVLGSLLFLWWTIGLWHLHQHDAAEVKSLEAELQVIHTKNVELKDQRDHLQSSTVALQNEKAEAEAQVFDQSSELEDRNGLIQQLQDDLQAVSGAASDLSTEMAQGAAASRRAAEASQTTLASVRQVMRSNQVRLATQKGEIQMLENRSSLLQNQIQVSQKEARHSSGSLQEAKKQQKFLQKQLKVAQGTSDALRKQLSKAKREDGKRLHEATEHEVQAVSKVQEQVKSSDQFIQKLLHRLAIATQQREAGEVRLAKLENQLKTKDSFAKDVAKRLQLLSEDTGRRLKIK